MLGRKSVLLIKETLMNLTLREFFKPAAVVFERLVRFIQLIYNKRNPYLVFKIIYCRLTFNTETWNITFHGDE